MDFNHMKIFQRFGKYFEYKTWGSCHVSHPWNVTIDCESAFFSSAPVLDFTAMWCLKRRAHKIPVKNVFPWLAHVPSTQNTYFNFLNQPLYFFLKNWFGCSLTRNFYLKLTQINLIFYFLKIIIFFYRVN